MTIKEQFASASDAGKSYEAICHEDGKLTCNCRGWIIKKNGKARTCRHLDQLIQKHGLVTRDQGDYRFVANGMAVPLSPEVARPTPASAPTASPTKATIPAPMLASAFPAGETLESFCGSAKVKDWAMEEKFDGHRVTVKVDRATGETRAWSRPRSGKSGLVRTLPTQITRGFEVFPDGIYDGELLIPGMHSYDVVNGTYAGQEIFVVFDVVELLGHPTVHETYDRRRSYLETIFNGVPVQSHVLLAKTFEPSVAAVKAIWKRGGEGAILKRKAARYWPGARSADFIKVKAVATELMTVTGYEVGKSGPYSAVRVVAADGSNTTVKTLDNDALRAFEANPASFIGRKLRIEFQERTRDGGYRHPRWDHWE